MTNAERLSAPAAGYVMMAEREQGGSGRVGGTRQKGGEGARGGSGAKSEGSGATNKGEGSGQKSGKPGGERLSDDEGGGDS